jgi:hypothetical protein
MFTKEIIGQLNTQIKSALDKQPIYQQAQYYGICRLVPRETEKGEQLMAALVDSNGEGFPDAGLIDDTFPMCVYHRCLGYSFAPFDQEQKTSFGKQVNIKSVANMLMIVFGNAERLKIDQERLVSNVLASMPSQLNRTFLEEYTGLRAVTIVPTSENNDQIAVYKNEGNPKYYLETNMLLFSVSYQIISEFDKSCYDICYC